MIFFQSNLARFSFNIHENSWVSCFSVLFQVVAASSIPDGWMGLDIGPDSIKSFSEALDSTQTIIWNGPMGVFEFDKFAAGTEVCNRG